ncbi:hypothetical protein [Thermoactinospora rubra]|uniref:hypothetical protein n=1 Tax=Thermoactinospora rubra TaxID=1088767 RepID=UPI00117D5AA5|nr:hypothetical protein [Thermoactinospora rubra]
MRVIAYLFLAAGTALIVWGLCHGVFVVRPWADSHGGEAQVALALYALARPFLLVMSGCGLMVGGLAAGTVARRR